jgi:hypothetical protein
MKHTENFRKVLDHIKANPNLWNQSNWHCGSAHCFLGHGQIMSGKPINDGTARRDGRIFFGMSYADSIWFSRPQRTIEDFENAFESDAGGYDRDGYHRDGYNRDGYDWDGYDWDGYDRDGYDWDGLDADNNPRPEVTA